MIALVLWIATWIDGAHYAEHQPTLTLDAQAMRVSGFSGCNRYTGGYEKSGWRIRFTAIAGTRMMCAPDAMKTEDAFTHALARVRSYRIIDRRLTFYSGDGAIVMRFTPGRAAERT